MWLRPGSPRPRRRRISVSVSALRICSSMSGRVSGRIAGTEETAEVEVTAEEDAEEFGTAATAAAPRALAPFPSSPASTRKIASTKSCTVSASATTRSGKRTPHASPSRSINSTRSRLPNPSSRSRCAFVPRATSSSIPRAPPNSTRSWRTDAKACAATAGLRSSFVPVAPMDRNGQFAAHHRAPRRGNCSGEPTTACPPIQSPHLMVPQSAPRTAGRGAACESRYGAIYPENRQRRFEGLHPSLPRLEQTRRFSLAFLCELCVSENSVFHLLTPPFRTKRNFHEPPFEYFRTGLNWAERSIDVPTPQRHTKSCSGLSKAPRMSAPPSPQCP